jgi:xanthine dehydrogenase accessory factor
MLMKHWIQKPFAFLGMIGSRRKRRLIFDQLLEEGWARAEALERVACPVGLDIGSISVPEIAVSVVAQLVQQRAALVCR